MTRINPQDGGTREYTTQVESRTALVTHGAIGQGCFFQDIVAGSDSHQIIVNTRGGSIATKGVSAATGTTQWLGQMSDACLQQMVHGHKESKVESTSSEAQRREAEATIVGDQSTPLPKQNLISNMRKGQDR